jgi:hypothetical protein
MLLSVFGTPSGLMHGGVTIVRILVNVGIGAHAFVSVNSTADFRQKLAELGPIEDARVVFCSDIPDADLCALFIKSRAPMVLFVDDFDEVVSHLSKARTMSVTDSIRLASRSVCALEPLIRSDMVLKFDSTAHRHALKDIILTLGTFFGVDLPAEKVDQVATGLMGNGDPECRLMDYLSTGFPPPPGSSLLALPAEDRRLISQLSAAYSAIVRGRSFDRMDWPVSLFHGSANPDIPFPGRVELLGPARIIIFGPFLHLSAGQWQAKVVFEISDNFSGNQLYVDVYTQETLSVITTELPVQGTYTFQVGFEISNPAKAVELRFHIMSGAIEGVFTLNSVSLERVGEVQSIADAGADQLMEAAR